MAHLYQRQDSLQMKAHHRSMTMKHYARWTPLTLFCAVIFLLFVWVHSKDELLVRTLESPHSASQTIAKQMPIHPEESNDQTEGLATQNPTGVQQECDGRRIFIYDLPAEFNDDLAADCKNWRNFLEWSMCDDVTNGGFGERMNLPASDPLASILKPQSAWFQTDQYSLDVTMHRRMKMYPCVTQDATQASMFYIPFYHALDLTRHVYNANLTTRDYLLTRMVRWLRLQEPFRLHRGHRHVLVLGRMVWDFYRRDSGPWRSTWGSPILTFPELANITKLLIERSPWNGEHQMAIPYPTGFHPSSEGQLRSWQATVRGARRPHLASFAGSARAAGSSGSSVRWELFDQCARSPRCKHLACTEELCHHNSQNIYKLALESVFCWQPPGDTPTRKGIFDSLLSGCIPVVFNRNQTVLQYLWHLPGDGSRYSVIIDGEAVLGQYDVMQHLEGIPRDEVVRLQENIVELLPRLLYRSPVLEGEYSSKDAFDVTVDSLLETFQSLDPTTGEES